MTEGSAISSIAESMKGQPACLAVVLLAAMMAWLAYHSTGAIQQRVHEREQMNKNLMLETLENCPLPDDRARSEHPLKGE
jgi:hypothetical protein